MIRRPALGYPGHVPRDHAPPPLQGLELEVLEEIWRQGEATVASVADAIDAASGSRRAYTTFLTVMRRLDAKGVVVRERRGKTDHYVAALGRDAYLEARTEAGVDDLLAAYGDRALVHFARRFETLDPARRAALEELARGE